MLEMILSIVGIVIGVVGIIVTLISISQSKKNDRHQISNHSDQG